MINVFNISQLIQLKSLEIDCEDNTSITDSGVKQLLDNCLHLRRLSLMDSNENLFKSGFESISTFMKRAKEMTKINYYYGFRTDMTKILLDVLSDIPDNLIIFYYASRTQQKAEVA